MKKTGALVIGLLALAAVVLQYLLMLENSTVSITETTIRFFSFFTILTNSVVAVYFLSISYRAYIEKKSVPFNFGTLTAVTVYIVIVGLVYQVLLRHIWNPEGLQKIVDELLHSVVPALVTIYWFANKKGQNLKYSQMGWWLIYPFIYLLYVLLRGNFSGFYPYPFINVHNLGMGKTLLNSVGMTLLFLIISLIFIVITNLSNRHTNRKA